ncbi:ABC transporter substrate-binding protein [Cohnella terricola]|uniref:ABC transporter substrate-binding protein n=1 Tax=Cohnella terricola TaxID=1289167 RepID=UPI00164775DA|nr:ABC transporter substrate-binding protein [Cohnella terricola]
MKARWKLLTTAAVLALSTALAGCGGSNGQDAAPSASGNGQQQTKAQDTNDKNFTIRVGAWFLDDRPHMQVFKKAVEEKYKTLYPNAQIQWDVVLGSTYFDKLRAQFASDSAPDVVFYQGQEFAKSGNLEDLSDEPWVSRLTDGAKMDVQSHYNGNTYALPMGMAIGGGVWYNKKIFADLDLQPPKTIDDWMQVNEKVKAAGKVPVTLGFKDSWTASMFLSQWFVSMGFSTDPQYGMKVYNGEIKLADDPAIRNVMETFEKMKKQEHFNKNALSIDWPQSGQMFASGDAAMIMQGAWMPGTNADNIQKGGFEPFDIGFFPLMDDKGNVSIQLSSNEAVGVNAKSKLKKEAKDLVNLITNQEIIAPFNKGEGSLAVLSDVTVQYDYPVLDELVDLVNKSNVIPYRLQNFIPASAHTSLVEAVTKVVSGVKFDPKDLEAAQDNFEKDKATVILP